MPELELIGQSARYGAVGLVNTLVGYTCIAVLQAAGVGAHEANAAGFVLGLCIGYVLNSRFTFRFRGSHAGAIARFVVAFLLAFLINQGVLAIALRALPSQVYVAQALAVASYAVVMFLALRSMVFRAVASRPDATDGLRRQ